MSLVLSFAASGFAQSSEDENSLAGLANRSKKKSEQSKVITGDDLRRAGGTRRNAPESVSANPSSSAEAEVEPAAGGDAEAEPEKTEDEIRADLKSDFQSSLAFHQANIETLRKAKQEAEADLGDLATATPSVTSTRRSKQMKLLVDIDRQIAEQEQAIADVKEQARRAGIRL